LNFLADIENKRQALKADKEVNIISPLLFRPDILQNDSSLLDDRVHGQSQPPKRVI
jgi:hypothetical protein